MKGWMGSVIGGVLAAAVVTYVWFIGSQRHPTPANELRDLAASPLCLSASGAPRPGSPTVEEAWTRIAGVAISGAHPLYHGALSIQLHYDHAGLVVPVGFIRVGPLGGHHWIPSTDPPTVSWLNLACGNES
jgi:hypothetical protein